MATAKKTTKKAAPKRAPAKSSSSTKVTRVARPKTPEVRSFRRARASDPFFTFRITHQTLYWLILAGIVLGLGLWVIDISNKVQKIYDQIDATNQQIELMDAKKPVR
jgi:hypothetical protein